MTDQPATAFERLELWLTCTDAAAVMAEANGGKARMGVLAIAEDGSTTRVSGSFAYEPFVADLREVLTRLAMLEAPPADIPDMLARIGID